MNNWWCIWENRLTPELCAEIIRIGSEIPDMEAQVGGRKETANDGQVIENSRRSKIKLT